MHNFVTDRHQWAALVRRIARICRRDDAEDLLHSALIRLEAHPAQEQVRDPAAYLVRVAANIGLDHHRRERRRAQASIDQIMQLCDESPLQDEIVEARERLDRVRTGLAKLHPRAREILLMHRVQGMRYREIAEAMNISPSAVEKHIAKSARFIAEWADGW